MEGLHTLPNLTNCVTSWCRFSGNERSGRKKYIHHIKADKVPTRRSTRLQSKDIPNMAESNRESPSQDYDYVDPGDDTKITLDGTEDDIPESDPMENVRLRISGSTFNSTLHACVSLVVGQVCL